LGGGGWGRYAGHNYTCYHMTYIPRRRHTPSFTLIHALYTFMLYTGTLAMRAHSTDTVALCAHHRGSSDRARTPHRHFGHASKLYIRRGQARALQPWSCAHTKQTVYCRAVRAYYTYTLALSARHTGTQAISPHKDTQSMRAHQPGYPGHAHTIRHLTHKR
jgi:hypothetical protein